MIAYSAKAARYFPISTAPSRTGNVSSSSIVPERRSSAKSRIVSNGSSSRRITLTFEKSGRITLSVTFRSRAIAGFIADCMDASVKNAKIL